MVFLFVRLNARAQLSTHEKPISFKYNIDRISKSSTNSKVLQGVDIQKLIAEDMQDEANGIPPRFGYRQKVDYSIENSGEWTTLATGDKIWRLRISSPGALSINLLYNRFWLPEKGKLFIYSIDKKHSIGAFTSRNNTGSKDNIQGFATGILYGDEIILEYYQPKSVKKQAIISIKYVVHGYRYINVEEAKIFGSSLSCNININCEEGQNWQNEKNAVALILVNGNRYCTGSLVNTTAEDLRPLFLTADHCLGGWANNGVEYDAVTNPNLSHYSFYWHYEHPGCSNSTTEPPICSTVGATVVANNSVSDFALLRLTENPINEPNITPYYLGWDKSGNAETGGVGIHHPRGDAKKISVDQDPLINQGSTLNWSDGSVSQPNTHWKSVIDIGTQEGGSSGSPFFSNQHKVIGQLHGGQSGCAPVTKYYGKFSISWTGNGANDYRRRLDHWLDPIGTGDNILDGHSPFTIYGPVLVCTSGSSFNIDNLAPGKTVSWTSSSNITFPSGNTGSSVSAQASSSLVRGNGWIEATLTSSKGSITLPRKDVWVGKPAKPLITGPSEIGCYKLGKYISDSRFPGVWFFDKIFDWSYATIQKRYDYSCEIESKNESGEIYLCLEVENRCGTWRNGKSISINKNSGGGDIPRSVNTDLLDGVELHLSIDTSSNETGQTDRALINMQVDSAKFEITDFMYMNILPNPANAYAEINFYNENEISEYQKSSPTMISINLDEQTQKLGEYEIQIWHERKGLVKKLNSKDKKLQIPTNNLEEGLYFLHVIINGKVYKQQLRVKR